MGVGQDGRDGGDADGGGGGDDADDGGDGDSGDPQGRLEVWVSADGCPSGGDGTQASPYCDLSQALAEVATGGTVRISGEHALGEGLVLGRDVTLEGTGDALLEAEGCPVLAALGGAQVVLRNLQISAESGSGHDGLIQASGGADLTFEDGRLGSSGCVGLRCVDATCRLRRAFVRENDAGGVHLLRSGFQIVNAIVAENGTDGQVGGVTIDQPVAGSFFIHNTVANNRRQDASNAGVVCASGSIRIENSILWQNGGDEVDGCPVSGSALSQAEGSFTDAGNNQTQFDPLFVADGEDYHIQAGSDCRDAGSTPSLTILDDIDGQARNDGSPDVGADEVDP